MKPIQVTKAEQTKKENNEMWEMFAFLHETNFVNCAQEKKTIERKYARSNVAFEIFEFERSFSFSLYFIVLSSIFPSLSHNLCVLSSYHFKTFSLKSLSVWNSMGVCQRDTWDFFINSVANPVSVVTSECTTNICQFCDYSSMIQLDGQSINWNVTLNFMEHGKSTQLIFQMIISSTIHITAAALKPFDKVIAILYADIKCE